MSPSSTRSPSAANRADKSKKKAKLVVLKLSPKNLRRFQLDPVKSEEPSPMPVTSLPAPQPETTTTLKVPEINDNASESASTPAPNGTDAAENSNGDVSKKRKGGSLAGSKRSLEQMAEESGTPKPRGKPGPKKKPRLEDGTIDHTGTKPVVTNGAGAAHKLGPKANQGAINAGLRALDRSGNPCRKWNKKSFAVKSFTGVVWELPSWKGGEKAAPMSSGGDSSETKGISQQSSSEAKPNGSDIAMDSNAGDRPNMSTPPASSPAPMLPPNTAISARG